ncbi:DinB family protein [Thermoactinospora rubra]|uniref:DinB family protein n=1 Tax=Thermoactinospora rubra TaxID=1088767 RepID=UPI000A0FBCD3|nr:DinB family protein [Thermoactinospora rubra]
MGGFTSPVVRVRPDLAAGEREALTRRLDYERATLLTKLEGLDDERLRRIGTPSGLSLLGLVKHLTETEHGWFVQDFAGIAEPDPYSTPEDRGAAFRVQPHETTRDIVEAYLAVCERAREIVARAQLDDRCVTPWGEQASLRGVLLHMIEETARHNGHADVIREAIDGVTGL